MGRQRFRFQRELASNLPLLQNLIRRDPNSYTTEFFQQLRHLESLLKILTLTPHRSPAPNLSELLAFVAHTLPCYFSATDELKLPGDLDSCQESVRSLPRRLLVLLAIPVALSLCPNLRKGVFNAVVLLCNKKALTTAEILPTFLELLSIPDKTLRSSVYSFIVYNLQNATPSSRPCSQAVIFKQLSTVCNKFPQNEVGGTKKDLQIPSCVTIIDPLMISSVASDPSQLAPALLGICIDLYRSKSWNDKKTANAIAAGCFSSLNSVMMRAVHFFLDPLQSQTSKDEEEDDDDDDEEEEEPIDDDNNNETSSQSNNGQATLPSRNNKRRGKKPPPNMSASNTASKVASAVVSRMKHAARVGRSSKSVSRRLEKAIKEANRLNGGGRKKGKKLMKKLSFTNPLNAPALHLLYDPHEFAERLFALAKVGTYPFETRILLLSLLSRVIAAHRICLPSFYSHMQKFLNPHQRSVTSFLAYTAQAVHAGIPTDVIAPIIRVIADNFACDHASGEVISAGINTIREICTRFPYAMTSELLADLIMFRSHRDKGVVMAARSLITVFREMHPTLLPRKQRGREASQKLIKKKADGKNEKNASLVLSENDDELEEMENIEEIENNIELPEKTTIKSLSSFDLDELVDEEALVARKKPGKANYDERMASIVAGRDGRLKYGSKKGKKEEGHSSSNLEKRKNKNFNMVSHSRRISQKQKASLRDKGRALRKHIVKSKKQRGK